MRLPTFAAQQKAWSSVLVDDIGYLPAKDLLAMPEDEFEALVEEAIENRYGGWRNYRTRWQRYMTGLGSTEGKRILDYGCGLGIEAVLLAEDNQVWIADINDDVLAVAYRVFSLTGGYEPAGSYRIKPRSPFLEERVSEAFDVVLADGVVHHIAKPEPLVKEMHEWLVPGGELRLMVYSNQAWKIAVGTPPPAGPVEDDPGFETFVQHWDPVGGYTDWYDKQRLKDRFGEWFYLENYVPLTQHGTHVCAILRKR